MNLSNLSEDLQAKILTVEQRLYALNQGLSYQITLDSNILMKAAAIYAIMNTLPVLNGTASIKGDDETLANLISSLGITEPYYQWFNTNLFVTSQGDIARFYGKNSSDPNIQNVCIGFYQSESESVIRIEQILFTIRRLSNGDYTFTLFGDLTVDTPLATYRPGGETTLNKIINGYTESVEQKRIVSALTQQFLFDSHDISSMYASVENKVGSLSEKGAALLSTLIDANVSGGGSKSNFLLVASQILSPVSQAPVYTDDKYFTFPKLSTEVCTNWTIGLPAIINSVGTVVSLALAIANPIIGAIVGLVSATASAIISAIEDNTSDHYSFVSDASMFCSNLCCFQGYLYIPNSSELSSLFEQNNCGILTFNTPFSVIIIYNDTRTKDSLNRTLWPVQEFLRPILPASTAFAKAAAELYVGNVACDTNGVFFSRDSSISDLDYTYSIVRDAATDQPIINFSDFSVGYGADSVTFENRQRSYLAMMRAVNINPDLVYYLSSKDPDDLITYGLIYSYALWVLGNVNVEYSNLGTVSGSGGYEDAYFYGMRSFVNNASTSDGFHSSFAWLMNPDEGGRSWIWWNSGLAVTWSTIRSSDRYINMTPQEVYLNTTGQVNVPASEGFVQADHALEGLDLNFSDLNNKLALSAAINGYWSSLGGWFLIAENVEDRFPATVCPLSLTSDLSIYCQLPLSKNSVRARLAATIGVVVTATTAFIVARTAATRYLRQSFFKSAAKTTDLWRAYQAGGYVDNSLYRKFRFNNMITQTLGSITGFGSYNAYNGVYAPSNTGSSVGLSSLLKSETSSATSGLSSELQTLTDKADAIKSAITG